MRTPGAAEMLNIWERSRGKSLIEKSMDLLYASSAGTEDHAALSIGERDTRLLRLRERMFGNRLVNVADCPRCDEHMEWETGIVDLLVVHPEKKSPATEIYTLVTDAYHIQFRLPNSYDIVKASADPGYRSSPGKLFSDCIIEVKRGTENYTTADLPDDVLEKLDQRMAEEDPQADITMLLNCPKCSHAWEMPFDIMSYLWIEIDSWAKHIFREVATLASTFGWSESDILNMSPRRRQVYLQMIRR